MADETQNIVICSRILDKAEFESNPEFYQNSFDEISLSLKIGKSDSLHCFFERHPINSIIYLLENNKVVSFIYATPYRDYEKYKDTDFKRWHIGYVQTHCDFQRKGYAKHLIVMCLIDILKKGGRVVSCTPNNMSYKLIQQIIEENGLSFTSKLGTITLLNLERIDYTQEPVLKGRVI